MKVAYITTRFPKLSETFIVNEVAAVRRLGIDVDLYAMVRERPTVIHPVAVEALAAVTFPSWRLVVADQFWWLRRRPGRYLSAWKRVVVGNVRSPRFLARAVLGAPVAASFARDIRGSGATHVHAHYATHSALVAFVVHHLTDIPFSVTAHAHDIQVDQTMLAEKLAAAAAVVTISDFNRRQLIDLVDADTARRIEVIRCGVDVDRFSPVTRTPSTTCNVAMVASLEQRKGHALALLALADVHRTGRRVHLDIVGDGEERARIEQLIVELDLGDVVTMHGGLTAPEVAAVLQGADVFVLPSTTLRTGKMEGIPVALMEAMACGLPVIATAMSGIPELVIDGQTGLTIVEGDHCALVAALTDLIDHPERRAELGASARRHVRREFSEASNAERLRTVFTRSSVPVTIETP